MEAAGEPVERFASPPARWLGIVMVVVAAIIIVDLLVGNPSQDYKDVAFWLMLLLAVWVVLVRPVVSANTHGVLMRNMVRDVFVPWSAIARARVFHTLQVVTHESQKFHGVGVSRTTRQIARGTYGRSSMLSGVFSRGLGSRTDGPRLDPNAKGGLREGVAYQDYIELTIERMARESRPDQREPTVAWAWPSVAMLVAIPVLAFVLLA